MHFWWLSVELFYLGPPCIIVQEVQPLVGREIRAALPNEVHYYGFLSAMFQNEYLLIQIWSKMQGSSETGNTGDVKSSEMQKVVHCSTQELLPSTIQEEVSLCKEYIIICLQFCIKYVVPLSLCSGLCLVKYGTGTFMYYRHGIDLLFYHWYSITLIICCQVHYVNGKYDHIITWLALPDNLVEKTPASNTQSSPKLSDRLREISNSLKLLSTRPVSVRAEKWDIECVRRINTIAPEPKTPEVHLKFEQAEDPKDILTARSTGIKVNLFLTQ